MGRLIDLRTEPALPSTLSIQVGDLLLITGTGGHVRSGADVVERLGPFIPGVIGTDGTVLSPTGAPNVVLFFARNPGRATIDVVFGDPFRAPRTHAIELTVE